MTESLPTNGEAVSIGAELELHAVAILAPFGQDASLIADAIRFTAEPVCVPDIRAFGAALNECGVGVLTTEALSPAGVEQLRNDLHAQPPWSDTPLILLANRIDPSSYAFLAEAMGNVVIIQRPLDPPSLLTVVKTAIRARQKQYQVRDLLEAGARQKEQIAALNEHLLLAVSAAEMGTWEVNLQTGKRIESASTSALFGEAPQSETISLEDWRARIHPDDRAFVVGRFESALRGDGEYRVEYRTNAPDLQASRWIIAKGTVQRNGAGEAVRVIGVVADITERKRAEEALYQRQQEIEALNERLKRAMTETHHRVKNSLQLISAFVEIQANEHETVVPIEELRRINTQVQTLAAVHDVLTQETKRSESDGLVSAKRLLEQLLPMLGRMTGAKQLRYRIEDVRLPSRQGTSLALVATELILNALKHSGEGVEATLTVGDSSAELAVIDDGAGLPKGFNVTQASNTGLALVENLVHWDLHGETSYANREDGGGALIRVTFPVSSGQSSHLRSPPSFAKKQERGAATAKHPTVT